MIVTVEVSPREAREAQNVAICQSNVCSGGNVCSCWFAWAVMEPNRWITVVSLGGVGGRRGMFDTGLGVCGVHSVQCAREPME